MGLRSRPTYRVVAIDSRRARDSRYLELLGHYDPRRKNLELKMERVRHWLANGAQASATVGKLIKRVEKQTPAPEPEVPPAATAETETPTEGVQP